MIQYNICITNISDLVINIIIIFSCTFITLYYVLSQDIVEQNNTLNK